MTDLQSEPKNEAEPEAGTPHWVKVFGYVALALVVFVVLHLFFGDGTALHG